MRFPCLPQLSFRVFQWFLEVIAFVLNGPDLCVRQVYLHVVQAVAAHNFEGNPILGLLS